ncbi:MAG: 4-hydroxy-tetrahydrodipicolinate reductase [Actinobacteria bacterium]|uniref:4-hydroxy-tetrahydrodipicolinate reductase n=1 Tax=freshwater metagenome TaxID=449393 RepID=A0A6J6E7S8_9ZZZZ|nr:4-hydroxy-tetrahydrodipicolinate reductase [Actinomycetota bacterium]MTA90024.1 4-hydroxy-tetrahydrodipicolinate reductase [Actinomycetota bacterium]
MISVSIIGATGRMGQLTKELVDTDPNLKLHAALDSKSTLQSALGADVLIDFTAPDVSEKVADFAITNSQKLLIGSSGWSEVKLAGLQKALLQSTAVIVVVPNFSIGSMLAQRFAAEAAKHFHEAEIIETHHAGKKDSPSGTAIRTAEIIGENRSVNNLVDDAMQSSRGQSVAGVPIHSVRLPGVSARQETIFAGASEQLSILHDVTSHHAYSLGILRAIEFTASAKGLTVGLERVLG